MGVWDFIKILNADYGILIQTIFIVGGFVATIIQLWRIKLSSRSNAMHQIVTSNRELGVLKLDYSSTPTTKGRKTLRALMTNHCAYLWEQHNLKAISDDWWKAIQWDMQQTFLNEDLRTWWSRQEVQKCYVEKFRNFMEKEILHKY